MSGILTFTGGRSHGKTASLSLSKLWEETAIRDTRTEWAQDPIWMRGVTQLSPAQVGGYKVNDYSELEKFVLERITGRLGQPAFAPISAFMGLNKKKPEPSPRETAVNNLVAFLDTFLENF